MEKNYFFKFEQDFKKILFMLTLNVTHVKADFQKISVSIEIKHFLFLQYYSTNLHVFVY